MLEPEDQATDQVEAEELPAGIIREEPEEEAVDTDSQKEEGDEELPTEDTFELDGKTYTAEQLKVALKDSEDYKYFLPEFTHKSQRLAELERAVPKEKLTDEQKEEEEAYNKVVNKVLQSPEMKQILAEANVSQQDKMVSNEIAYLGRKYEDFDAETALQYASTHRECTNLDHAYLALKVANIGKSTQNIEKKVKADIARKKRAVVGSGSSASASKEGFRKYDHKKSYEDNVAEAEEDFLKIVEKE